ncbi:MAG: glycerol-3-phosphate dehydrogenase/oxidase [Bacteroidetes bacterium]|nr:MAG: glycerol-3-phosphate dehydrogenase/oxidase [Bacteroidota bacterium]TAF94159.1 MAG: glycerol-3-phosphate dehydrogenase/oxidase [Bacteroidota bacterium]
MKKRTELLHTIQQQQGFDIVIIGGGATGLGTALDACLRGHSVLLLEQFDFGKGTSSKSTKLVHGGVRYLAQGNLKLVMQALKERGRLLTNAPSCTYTQEFVIPTYSFWWQCYYYMGLKLYDILAGRWSLGATQWLSKNAVQKKLPSLQTSRLVGGISYTDGAFDDTRLLMLLLQHAIKNGAYAINHCSVTSLITNEEGTIGGVVAYDSVTETSFSCKAKVVINATGVFADNIMKMSNAQYVASIRPSQGIHLVIQKKFFAGNAALMIPKTADGRVLFAVPWQEVILVGTTDTPIDTIEHEPQALDHEIDFILSHFNEVNSTQITKQDVNAVYVGLRPLLQQKNAASTAVLSRDHAIIINEEKLLTVTGGKWTTYRKMAEDAVNNAAFLGNLPKQACATANYTLTVHTQDVFAITSSQLSQQQVAYYVQYEMAYTVEDVLARRTRLLFKNVRQALAIAPQVAEWLQALHQETDAWRTKQLQQFTELAKKYSLH